MICLPLFSVRLSRIESSIVLRFVITQYYVDKFTTTKSCLLSSHVTCMAIVTKSSLSLYSTVSVLVEMLIRLYWRPLRRTVPYHQWSVVKYWIVWLLEGNFVHGNMYFMQCGSPSTVHGVISWIDTERIAFHPACDNNTGWYWRFAPKFSNLFAFPMNCELESSALSYNAWGIMEI